LANTDNYDTFEAEYYQDYDFTTFKKVESSYIVIENATDTKSPLDKIRYNNIYGTSDSTMIDDQMYVTEYAPDIFAFLRLIDDFKMDNK
jgi:hypothetical protein